MAEGYLENERESDRLSSISSDDASMYWLVKTLLLRNIDGLRWNLVTTESVKVLWTNKARQLQRILKIPPLDPLKCSPPFTFNFDRK